MAKIKIDEIIKKEKEKYTKKGSTSLERMFFNNTVLPTIKDAVATLEKSNPSSRKLFLIVEDYVMPLELQKKALDILLSRLAKKEIMKIVNNRATPFELQKQIAKNLLDSLIKKNR